jgi:hypothetical protein
MSSASFGLYDIQFRSPIESDRLNDIFNDIAQDIGEAHTITGRINARVREIKSDMSYQMQQLVANQALVDAQLDAAHTHYDNVGGRGLLYWSAYNESDVTNLTSRHDVCNGEVTLPWTTSWTKIPLTKDEDGYYRATGDVSIEIDGLTMPITDDAYDMVDNNPETTWAVSHPTSQGPITGVVHVPDLFSTYINSVMVSPFPEGGCSVTSLEYANQNNTYIHVPDFVAGSSSRRYHFNKVSVPGGTSIRFILTGTTLNDSNGALVKVFGMKNIDISLIEYASTSTFRVKLQANNNITTLLDVIVDYTFDGIETGTRTPMILQLTTDEAGTSSIYDSRYTNIGNGITVSAGSAIWAQFTLNKLEGSTPVVRGLTVRYR